MNNIINTENKDLSWNWKSWVWVFLCAAGIYATVPVARRIQKFVYDTVGRDFFTYAVLFVVGACLLTLLYLFVFKFRIKKISQYIWLVLCAGLYGYFGIQLRQYPEEAVHLLEYGLLAYFVFNALSYRIRDWTVYISTVFFVLLFGTTDEFIQWMMPERYWGLNDVRINALAGLIFVLAVWKGIAPRRICMPVSKVSIRVLAGIVTVTLIYLGLCLSNTPEVVKRYTAVFNSLSWLRSEEPMTEYGHKYNDPEIGTFYSRFTLDELKRIDYVNGNAFGNELYIKLDAENKSEEGMTEYSPYTNPFLYEFLIHAMRIKDKLSELEETDSPDTVEISNTVYREYLILQKNFENTLKHSRLNWDDNKMNEIQKTASLWKEDYTSEAGTMITSFSLKKAWMFIITLLTVIWSSGLIWAIKVDDH